MAYEIDFLPVGDGERGGDAIALRRRAKRRRRAGWRIFLLLLPANESLEEVD